MSFSPAPLPASQPNNSPKLQMLQKIATECNYDLTRLADLYGQLSAEIHGASWSGPGIRAHLHALPDEPPRCFMRALAAEYGLGVDEQGKE